MCLIQGDTPTRRHRDLGKLLPYLSLDLGQIVRQRSLLQWRYPLNVRQVQSPRHTIRSLRLWLAWQRLMTHLANARAKGFCFSQFFFIITIIIWGVRGVWCGVSELYFYSGGL